MSYRAHAENRYLKEQSQWPDAARRCGYCKDGDHEECYGYRDLGSELPCLCWHLGPPAEDGEPPVDFARVEAQTLAYKRYGVC